MSSSTFVKRLLSATVSSGSGQNFAGSTSSQINLAGLRTSAKISHAGGFVDSTLDLTIWGMTDTHMNALSTFGMQIQQVTANQVTLQAGNDQDGLATAFTGYIVGAYADYANQPEVCFRLTAHAAYPQKVVPAQASSFSGSADVATIASGLANTMGFQFENNGVNVKLSNPYFSGSAMDQFNALKKAAGIEGSVINGTLAIWPRNGSRGGAAPVVSVQTGMIGYPTFTAYGLMVSTIYNPSIGLGQKIQVVSSLQPACMTGTVYALDHELESLVPKGKWFSHVAIYNPQPTDAGAKMTEAATGTGQQGPSNSSHDYNYLVFVIAQQLAKISTVKIVQVQSVQPNQSGSGGTVSVQIMTNQIDGAGNATPHGTINGIPYFQSQWGNSAVIGTPAVDDVGIMVCADRDISAVKSTQAVANPGSERQFDAADGIYLGGIVNPQTVKQFIKFTDTGISMQDVNNNTLVSGPAGGWTVNQLTVTGALTAEQNLQLGGNLVSQTGTEYAGTIQTSGDVIAGSISLKGHVHTDVEVGSGNTGPAIG